MTSILLVEDNITLRTFLAHSLRLLGDYEVIEASDGVEALSRLEQAPFPDGLVLDVMMPNLDGYQLTRAIRGDPRIAHLPLIILTAMAQDQDRFTGLASGADRFLIKPILPTMLVAVVAEVLGLGEQERQRRLISLAQQDEAV